MYEFVSFENVAQVIAINNTVPSNDFMGLDKNLIIMSITSFLGLHNGNRLPGFKYLITFILVK